MLCQAIILYVLISILNTEHSVSTIGFSILALDIKNILCYIWGGI